jgi:O-antigen/teichoic acid export membrane protein
VCAMMFEVSIDPGRCALAAMGKNRLIALLEVTEAILNVSLSIVLGRLYGALGVALGMAIPMLVMKLLVAPRFVCRLTNLPPSRFYGVIAPIVVITGVYLGGYAWIAHQYLMHDSYFSVILVAALAAPLYLLIAWRFFFDASELELIKKMLPGRRAAAAA